jgi:hypothetical protein
MVCCAEVARSSDRDGPGHHHWLQHLQFQPALPHEARKNLQSARLPLLGPQPQDVRHRSHIDCAEQLSENLLGAALPMSSCFGTKFFIAMWPN